MRRPRGIALFLRRLVRLLAGEILGEYHRRGDDAVCGRHPSRINAAGLERDEGVRNFRQRAEPKLGRLQYRLGSGNACFGRAAENVVNRRDRR